MSLADALVELQQLTERLRRDWEWAEKNWHVVKAFEATALRLIRAGHKHYSARAIVYVLAFHSAVREDGCEYKIGNDNATDLAQIFCVLHPEHVDFWEFRRAGWKDFRAAVAA